MDVTVLERIKNEYDDFSKSHKKVADFILSNYEKATTYTAAKFGAETGISESTVVRFATYLGYEGFPEFQADLRECIKGKLTSMQRIKISQNDDNQKNILDKILNSDIQSIKATRDIVSIEDFETSCNAINNAEKIYILGVRSSAPLANFMYHYFHLVYDNVVLIDSSSSSSMFEELYRIDSKSVLIAVSFPRYSRQVVKALQFVHDKGGIIIGITDSNKSPIADLSDYVLYAKSSMASFMDSLVAPMSLINALIVASAHAKKNEVISRFEELERAWDKYDVYF